MRWERSVGHKDTRIALSCEDTLVLGDAGVGYLLRTVCIMEKIAFVFG